MGRVGNLSDRIMHYVFDTVTVATAATLATFFKNPNAGAQLTNLRTDGRFASPESFLMHSIQLAVPMGTAVADVNNLFNATGTLTLYVGKTWYIDHWPLNSIPISTGIFASQGAATAIFGGAMSGVACRKISPPIPFNTDEPYSVEIRWGTGPTLTASVPVQVILGGTLTRQVQ